MLLSYIKLGCVSFSDSGGDDFVLIGNDGYVAVIGVEMGATDDLGKFVIMSGRMIVLNLLERGSNAGTFCVKVVHLVCF